MKLDENFAVSKTTELLRITVKIDPFCFTFPWSLNENTWNQPTRMAGLMRRFNYLSYGDMNVHGGL
jgi:hypothetical protein